VDKSNLLSTPIAGLFIKIAVAVNTIAIVIAYLDVSIPEANFLSISYWPWLIISTPIVLFLLWKHYKTFNAQLDMMVPNALSGGNAKPILLYLRPFITDGDLMGGGDTFINSIKGMLQIFDTANLFEGKLLSVVREKYIPVKFDESEKNESKKLIYKIKTMFSYRCGKHFDDTDKWLDTVDRTLNTCTLCIICSS